MHKNKTAERTCRGRQALCFAGQNGRR